jgi:integrase
MAEKINFTQQRIDKLPVPEDGRIDYYDANCPKLTCRVSRTGVKSFVLLKWNGKTMQRITLGRFPDVTVAQARKLATDTLSTMAEGINPIDIKRKEKIQSITLSLLLDKYIEHKNLKDSTAKNYRVKFNQGFADWAAKPINQITRDMVLMRQKLLTGTAITRDNKMRVLRLLMKYAVAIKAIPESPTDVLRDAGLWSKARRKTRIISSDNLMAWYKAVIELDSPRARTYLLMLLYTGLRSSEALSLKWKDVDFKNATLVVKDTKNHSDFLTYIPKQLMTHLKIVQEETGNYEYVFSGFGKNVIMDTPRWHIDLIIKKTGIKFSSHDLRRTFATIAEAALLPETIIKRLLNHATDNNVTTGYIRTESNTLWQAIERIAGYIEDKVSDNNIPHSALYK